MIYTRESHVAELRPGEYWIEGGEKGTITVTRDPTRASQLDGQGSVLPETLEVFPGARMVRILVTVYEL